MTGLETYLPVVGSLVVDCPHPLVTNTAQNVVRTFGTLQRASRLARLAAWPKEERLISFRLSSPSLDPGGLLLLLYTLNELGELDWTVYGAGPASAVETVLEQLQHLHSDQAQREKLQRLPGDFMMREVTNKDAMVREIKEWADTVREGGGKRFDAEDVARWQTQVGEVVANAFQHGGTQQRVVLVGHASKDEANLAALDDGRGIPSVIGPHVPEGHPKRPGDLIAYACEEGTTSRCSRHNQGRGLYDLVRMVKDKRGSLRIFSAGGLCHVTNRRMYRRNSCTPTLSGTLVLLTLKPRGVQ